MTVLLNAQEVTELENKDAQTAAAILQAEKDVFNQSIEGVILNAYYSNRDARRYSGVEEEIADSINAYNGVYNQEDLARLDEEGGSRIFMNLTATKSKVARSWVNDIMGEQPFSIESSPVQSLPEEIVQAIEDSIQRDADALSAPEQPQGQPPVQGQVENAQESIKKSNQIKRDAQEAILREIKKESDFEVSKMEVQVRDQLLEGDWDQALNDFTSDFTIYPNAFMKGPIITKKKRITWENGQPIEIEDYIFLNKRVSPWDIYPSPAASSVHEGNFIEHTRHTLKDIHNLKGVPGYDETSLNSVIASPYTYQWLDTGIEQEKDESERRSSYNRDNREEIHGLHFFGSLLVETIMEWPGANNELVGKIMHMLPTDIVDVEAIIISGTVVKVALDDNPLGKRPYYTASYLNVPGSFWGRSLPSLMNDIQRMCNATSRALSNNLAMASGPQVEVMIDRLADDGDIEEMYPRKVWQVKTDPTGGGSSKAINFFQPTSNASELLAVYEKYEARADDVTGIPRYAYGNDKMAGAGTTVGGLALLLESTSKIVKDAIRNIDNGLIKPRVESQFYYNLLKNPDLKFTGDINVIPTGSSILTVRAAQRLRQNEFLQTTANPIDQKIMGLSGRAILLREVSEGCGLSSDIIPSALELSKMEAEDKQAAQQAAQMEQERAAADHEASLVAVKIQSQAQLQMSELTQQVKANKNQTDAQLKQVDQQLEASKIQATAAGDMAKGKSYENAAMIKAKADRNLQMDEFVYNSTVSPNNKGV